MIDEKRFSQYNKTFTELQSKISTGNNSFRPQKVGNNIELLAGVDGGKYAISIVSEKIDIETSSTTLINLKHIQISEKKEALVFSLMDEELLSIFISFCIDIESLLDFDDNISIVEVYNRYIYWQKMFKVEPSKVSEAVIKGLISELHTIESYLIPKYGITEAVNGWTGTDSTHKDFAYKDNIWYEVKAISVGKTTVKISSIEQLESSDKGMLVVTELEKTSKDYSQGTRLIDLLNTVKDKIEFEEILMLFYNKIVSLGISLDVFLDAKHPVNLHRYIIKETHFYNVDEKFPRLEREALPLAVGLVSYELILPEIEINKTRFY